ncbi:MAG: TIGR02646 family protein [Scytonematopsis contorta HA4267-MV1]|nr:TIGR02646 family protein [Scytonematopsis contorta HA4267-MV1]
MKYINKSEEPESFITWKQSANDDWQPNWENFGRPQKQDVHNSLLQEQGFICCYCGRRISNESSHIEHFKPRKNYPELALKYTNLLASCQRETERKEPLHCGRSKDEWYEEDLMISPLDANCADFFRYTEDGQILPIEYPSKKSAAKTTIDRLALNIDNLKNLRSSAIQGALEGFDDFSDEEKLLLIQGFEQRNSDYKYEEFCAAIVYVLKQYV